MLAPSRETKTSIAFEFCRISMSCGLVERCLIALIAVARSFRGKASLAFRSPEEQGVSVSDRIRHYRRYDDLRIMIVLVANASRTLPSA